jgi:hypothetical protein
MKKYFLLPALGFILFFPSCEEDLNVNLPASAKKIVIEGSIENGKVAEVMITKNVPLFSSVGSLSISDYLVTDAKVYVSNGIITDTLTLSIDTASSLPLVYKGSTIFGMPGQTYYLTVLADGNTLTSTTTIPSPVALDSVWWKPQPPEDSLGFAWAHLSEPAGSGNSYRWYAKRPTKDRRFIAPFGATFDDKFVDGKGFDFAYTKGYDPTDTANSREHDSEKERDYYKFGDTIIVKFCTIDKATKDFYTTFETAEGNNGNPFASPVTILSNINGGGLGVWAGFGVTYDTIYAH